MKKMLSVLGFAVAVLVVALALTVGGAEEALAGKKDGCPKKTQEFVKVCIEKKSRAGADFDTASADCADEAGRLPTVAELEAFRQQPGIKLGSTSSAFEWTGDIIDVSTTLSITDSGGTAPSEQTVTDPYRCVK